MVQGGGRALGQFDGGLRIWGLRPHQWRISSSQKPFVWTAEIARKIETRASFEGRLEMGTKWNVRFYVIFSIYFTFSGHFRPKHFGSIDKFFVFVSQTFNSTPLDQQRWELLEIILFSEDRAQQRILNISALSVPWSDGRNGFGDVIPLCISDFFFIFSRWDFFFFNGS